LNYGTYGKEIVADFHGCKFEIIDSLEYMKASCETAAKMSGAKILSIQCHKFKPQGLTILIALSESHLTIHTSPEHGVLNMNIYTCGKICDPEKAYEYMKMILKPTEIHRQVIERGV
jgi:S-adenosylmethionine decarboxylase